MILTKLEIPGVKVSTLAFALIALGITYLFFKSRRPKRISKFLDAFPGPKWFPFFGTTLPFIALEDVEIAKRSLEMLKEYGGYYRMWVFNKPWLVVGDAAIVEKVLRSEHSRESPEATPFLGSGILLSHEFKQDRKELKLCLNSPTILKEFLPTINQRAKGLVQEIRMEITKGENSDKPKDYNFNFFRYIVNTFSQLSLGDFNKKFHGELLVHVLETMRMGIWYRMYKPFLNIPILWDLVGNGLVEKKIYFPFRDEAHEFIEEKLQKQNSDPIQSTTSSGLKLFDTLLSGKIRKRSAKNIFDNIICFYAASSDSTGCALSSILYTLAKHPKYQESVREEILSVFGSKDELSMKDLEGLELLELCIKESLRLYPVLVATGRKLLADIVIDENKGTIIPEGANVAMLFPYALRDPNVYKNPNDFIPERFMSRNGEVLKNGEYLVFGVGNRNCIGQKYAMNQLKTTLAHILRSFTVTSPAEDEDLKMFYDIACAYKGGIPLLFKNA